MTNRHCSTLYTGLTNDIERRVHQHKTKAVQGFTSRHHVDRLVYYEETDDIGAAIAREKQIKGWTRARKIALINSFNPRWIDLAETWFARDDPVTPQRMSIPATPPPDSFAKLRGADERCDRRSE